MPLVEVEIVGEAAAPLATISRALADELGEIFASRPAQTWVRVRTLAVDAYAENAAPTPLGAQAVFVTITRHSLPETAPLALEARRVTASVARICARPVERVHVLYAPPAAGRIAFGGNLAT